jgi:phage anti-repressor protein
MLDVINKEEYTDQTPIEILLKIDKDGFTTAKNLYDYLQLDKSHYSRWCKSNIVDNDFAEEGVDYIYSPSKASKSRGNFSEDYKITATFAKKLSMTAKCERGERARCYFIACEETLKQFAIRTAEERKQWEIERAKGVVIRHILTDTIKMKVVDSPHKKFMYPNYTKLIYKILFGKTMNELRAQYGVKGKESIREYITSDQLKEVDAMEMLVSSLINCGWGYDQIKGFVQQNHIKQIDG